MNFTHKVLMETNKGNILMGFYGKQMPITVENFINHVEAGYYKNLIFHRVIPGFVIQGGGFLKGMLQKQEIFEPIKLEIDKNIKHTKYTLSMARTNDPNSATSQFFICTDEASSLDNQYAAFGMVIEGQEVVDEIANIETHSFKWFDDVPKTDVVIKSAQVVKE